MIVMSIGAAAFIATFLGGLFALKFKDKLHLITGFSAGAIIGVAFFDLLPEAVTLKNEHQGISTISLMIGIGFIVYMILERAIVVHSSHESGCENSRHRGILGAGSLSIHSFLDGVIIGLAFQISNSVGTIVTVAVLTHDFSDGINTVTMIVRSKGERRQALRWLIADAFAPVLGICTTFFYSIPKEALSIVLSVFCGCFIYIGASDLLPESHHAHPKTFTTFMTLLGMATLYAVIQIAG
ncbi:MAG: ZIP family metal transporter [Bacteroidota bacterium]